MSQETALGALVAAVGAAAQRRGMSDGQPWQAVSRVLADWCGDAVPAREMEGNLDAIAAVFGLDGCARDLLLVAAAADLDPNVALAYGLLVGSDSPRPATAALALELAGVSTLSPVGRAALGAAGPLRRWGLVHVGAGEWALGRALTADDGVIGALLGAPVDDPLALALAVPSPDTEDVLSADGVGELAAALAGGPRLCWVENPPGGAGVTVAGTAFAVSDIRCVTVDLARRPGGVTLAEAMRVAIRDAGLRRAGLLIESAEVLAKDDDGTAAIGIAAASPIPVVMVGSCRWNAAWRHTLPITVRASPLTTGERLAVWRRYIDPAHAGDAALMPYRLTPGQIETVARYAGEQARIAARPVDPVLIADAVRMLGGTSAVRSGLGWVPTSFKDLQLPDETRAELERLASWVRLRDAVTSGGAVQGLGGKGTGIAALFTGGPGTGKTLAAHVIADTAGLDLMQVDLSGVVDKYIGETEKNLERIFTDAESLNVVLFFDEADSLFGKRSEVRDAHDRFANQEVAYLLQRMEQFDGITVLATNLKGNLDVAFSRRLHFIVHFPDPDEATRERLWQGLLSQAGPMDGDDPVDVPKLAAALQLSGGDIRNIVMGAVYDAAAAGRPVGMRQVTAAAVREYAKLGRRAPGQLGGPTQ
jgi:hypothetical protein